MLHARKVCQVSLLTSKEKLLTWITYKFEQPPSDFCSILSRGF